MLRLIALVLIALAQPAAAGPVGNEAGIGNSLVNGLPPSLAVAQQHIIDGRPREAIAQARAFLDAGPGRRAAAMGWEILGTALFLDDQTEEAVKALRRAVEFDRTRASAWTKLGSIAIEAGDMPRAQEWLQMALSLDPGQALARERMGTVLERRGDIPAAIASYEAGMRNTRPEYLGSKVSLAVLYNRQGRYAETVRLLQPIGLARLTDIRGKLALGIALLVTDNPEAAHPFLIAAEDQAPGDDRVAIFTAIAHRQVGEAEAALKLLRRITTAKPDNVAGQFQLGLALIGRSDYPAGRRALEAAYRLDPVESEQQHLFVGRPALGIRPADAVAVFEALARRPGARLSDTLLLARVYEAAGQPQNIERAWREAVARFPKDGTAHWRLINLLAAARNYTAALAAFEASQKELPDDPRLLVTGSLVHARMGQLPPALALAQRAATLSPADPMVRLQLAILQDQSGEAAAAATSYRAVLASQPDNPVALNNLATIEAERDPPTAVGLARRARALLPENADVADTLGWALLRAGRSSEAVSAMTEALKLNPDSPRQTYRLALAQHAAGDIPGARAGLVKAITTGPFPEIDEARALLQKISR